jgi:hypothetical protein
VRKLIRGSAQDRQEALDQVLLAGAASFRAGVERYFRAH